VSLEAYFAVTGTVVALAAAFIAYLQLRRTPKIGMTTGKQESSLNLLPNSDERTPSHNLPAREQFIGRGAEKARLFEGLTSSYPVIAVEGLGGMGKTAVAREVAWLCAESTDRFRAIVWTEDLDGSLRLNDVLDAVADVLGYAYLHSMPMPDKEKEVLKHLRSTSCLLIVDNLETVTDQQLIDFITRVPEPLSKAIVTSRDQQLRTAWAVTLGRLEPADGLELIRKEASRLGLRGLYEAPAADLRTLYDATGGNPLAIRLGTGQMKAEGASLNEIIAELNNAEDNDLFKVLFARSWDRTLAGDEYARRVLATLALCSGPTSRTALEAGSDVHHTYLRSALMRLIAVSLVDTVDIVGTASRAEGRYQLHTLTRAFVRRQLARTPETGTELRDRLEKHFLEFVQKHANTYDDLDNVHKIEAELPNIMAFADAVHQEAVRKQNREAWRMVIDYADAMSSFLWGRGFWADRVRLCERAIDAATMLGDNVSLARHAVLIGRVYLWLRDSVMATAFLKRGEEALAVSGQGADSSTKRLRAQIASAEGDFDVAKALLKEVLNLAPKTADDDGQAATHVELGLLAERQGDLDAAKIRYEKALRLDDELAAVEGRAVSLSHLGKVLLAIGDYAAAETIFRDGLVASAKANRLSASARCELGLARLYARKGERDKAAAHAGQAEQLYSRLGQPQQAAEARALLDRAVTVEELP
jgi:tetratricopeptide (TPR) repeat protein